MAAGRTDGRVERGNHTRRLILQRTVDIASVEGLEGLSLGRLAAELNLSKSGVFALFGSKEELQLATVRAAVAVYLRHVVQPAREVPAGLGRVWRLCESWMGYSQGRVFPGGCFFYAVSAEFDARRGRVHDAIAAARIDWVGCVEQAIEEARAGGQINDGVDTSQLAFELIALLETANAESVLHDDDDAYRKATIGILRRLHASAATAAPLPALP